MARPVLLYSGQWTDLPLEELTQKASEWGYQGLELACWGDHFEVQRALSEDDYCQRKLELLGRHELAHLVLGCHRVSQAICDPIDARHQHLLPDYVWGDGEPRGVQQRAVAEMLATIRAAERLGVAVLGGFTGSPLWSYVVGYPAAGPEVVAAGLAEFARRWNPILDACRDAGIRYAFEVHPGQIAFDLYSAEMALDALDGREEFGFTFDPSHFFWQGIDPVEFIRRFPERIYHVHVKDTALTLNGRGGVLNSYLPHGDARRGWQFRAPGHGGIDWEAVIRALNDAGYEGPLAVEFKDAGMEREQGAEAACKFVKRLDFAPRAVPAVGSAARESATGAGLMNIVSTEEVEALRRAWTDQYVKVNPERPELRRFLKKHDKPAEDLIGRVVAVNWNGKAIIDFQDGGWYDITASEEHLIKIPAAEAKAKFDFKANSAQPVPDKQG